jgi:hypothetical protein
MADPLTMAIATGAAGQVAGTLTEQGQQAVAAIVRRMRERFRGKPAETAVLDQAIAETAPEGSFAVESLARALEREFAADARFRDEVLALWQQVTEAALAPGAVNVFSGTARTVTQIGGDVHGDIEIG